MALQPLRPTPHVRAPQLDPVLTCTMCHAKRHYALACTEGWTYDPHGIAFVTYFCAGCTARVEAQNIPTTATHTGSTP